MAVFTSRFSNPELRKGLYSAVRIALGSPRWDLGYRLDGEIKDLMPFGLFGKYDDDAAAFKREYFARLDRVGVSKILSQLKKFEAGGKDVVLLCYEDVRKGENDWCHRTMFAEWWFRKTGQEIRELYDPSTPAAPKVPKASKSPNKPVKDVQIPIPQHEQLGIF